MSSFDSWLILCSTPGFVLQMFTLWEVPVNGGNGKERFGDDYADIYAIQRIHFKAAMNKSCDHVSTEESLRSSRCSNLHNNSRSGWIRHTCVPNQSISGQRVVAL